MIMQAIETFNRTPRHEHKSGVSARYVQINKNWGLKVYQYVEERDKTYRFQKLAAEHGLAPKLGQKVQVDRSFGYLTESVASLMSEEMDYSQWDASDECNDLIVKLHRIGFWAGDLHHENAGRMADGRIVCIDFGHFALQSE
jgi:tRNA A-37 threonylcarbamoyl transferase component Bud32